MGGYTSISILTLIEETFWMLNEMGGSKVRTVMVIVPALPSITGKKTQKHLNCVNERIDKQRLTENYYK